ncbi:MAG TPA: DUF2141 domain-containing protein [Sphingomonas sp.]|nr:DUF2141 domain-containing protein [Sphingomonas sp.]
MLSAVLLIALSAPAHIDSRPDLGIAEGRCRPGAPGSDIFVDVEGLKDRKGRLRLELYPPDDADFLSDDNLLIEEGKTFRRVDVPVPQSGPVRLCIRAPGPGVYTMSLLHDRDSNHKFGLSTDGIGFPGNPRLGWSKPKAAQARIVVNGSRTETRIILNYRHGLFSFSPLRNKP